MTPTPDTSREALRERIAAASYEFTKDYQRRRGTGVPDFADLPWAELPALQKKFGYEQVDWLLANVPELRALSASPAPSRLTEEERAKVKTLRFLAVATGQRVLNDAAAIIDRLSSQAPSASKPLFVAGDFIAHSGITLPWKINCDALTDADWRCLAEVAAQRLLPFSEVVGVPRGGIPFAKALTPYVEAIPGAPRLIVDDVLTTGASMREAMTLPDDVGLVVFARGPLPPRVTALFTLAPSASGDADKDRLRSLLYDVLHNGLIYWLPQTARGFERKAAMMASVEAALRDTEAAPAASGGQT